jgi:hypothetical protein
LVSQCPEFESILVLDAQYLSLHSTVGSLNETRPLGYYFSVMYIIVHFISPTVAEWSRRTYPAPLGAGGVGSIPANSEAQNVPSFRRWQFEMKFSPFFLFKNAQKSRNKSNFPHLIQT